MGRDDHDVFTTRTARSTETIDPMGHTTTTFYDADGEVTETIDPLGT